MINKWSVRILLLLLSAAALVTASACLAPPSGTSSPTAVYTQYQLEYNLFAKYGDVFWWDPDYYPVARVGQEEKNAAEQFATIRANTAEFSAVLLQLKLAEKPDYTADEKLGIYREHKKLTRAVEMTTAEPGYHYVLRVGQNQGFRIEGTISNTGTVTEAKREPSSNIWPICLTRGTLIDTPAGEIPVEKIVRGMTVWSLNEAGERIAVAVAETGFTPFSSPIKVVRLTLCDGRSVTASPGHHSAEGRALGDYQPGNLIDGAAIVAFETLDYDGGATYDILPAGATGLYRADGVLLKSTFVSK